MLIDPNQLNADCACISLDRQALSRELDATVGETGFAQRLDTSHPSLLSNLPVYLRSDDAQVMAALIATIEKIAQISPYQSAALAVAPALALHRTAAPSVLMGYDFHIGKDGPKLIEINTNAGGALINAALLKAQKVCCAAVMPLLSSSVPAVDPETAILASFLDVWKKERGNDTLRTIAIVDTDPEHQFLYPEFELFQRLFQRHGLEAIIAPPDALHYDRGQLRAGDKKIDLVYNRLTDFGLEDPASQPLRNAYTAGDVVVTPNPWAHALFADKRNLVRLTDSDLLQSWGVADEDIARLLAGIPKTVHVTANNAADLWSRRSSLFFKPASGFGSKAAYRGEKITKRVWETVIAGGYIAQDLVAPSTRTVVVDGARQHLKVDIRNYTYDGHVQLIAARLYQGQTTNMRTPGGGFAPVLSGIYAEPPSCSDPVTGACACD